VATASVRYGSERSSNGSDSDQEVPERWVAYPQDIQRILSLQKELERVKEREKWVFFFFFFVYSYSHATYIDHGGVHFARFSCPQSARGGSLQAPLMREEGAVK